MKKCSRTRKKTKQNKKTAALTSLLCLLNSFFKLNLNRGPTRNRVGSLNQLSAVSAKVIYDPNLDSVVVHLACFDYSLGSS